MSANDPDADLRRISNPTGAIRVAAGAIPSPPVTWIGKGAAMNTRKEAAMATTPESFVDALNSASGKQTTQRSAHAKGVVLLGKFVPSAEAASVSKALHFKHEVPVTVRFS